VNFHKTAEQYQKDGTFVTQVEEYHRMKGYFNPHSYVRYEGDFITLTLKEGKVTIHRNASADSYLYSKLCYIPAERNLVAALPTLKKYNDTNDVILYFLYDWYEAREYLKEMELKSMLERPVRYAYSPSNEADLVYDGESPALRLSHASSGIQSLVPLSVVIKYILEDIYRREIPLTAEQKMQAKHTFSIQRSNLFIEEPEQNLFPSAQQHFIYSFVNKMTSSGKSHTAILTTHSPFILFSLNNCLMGGLVGHRMEPTAQDVLPSKRAWINPRDVSVYEIHDGHLQSVQDEDGLLMENYLNESYNKINEEYLKMLAYYGD
jgi:hypothetical protein